MNAESAKTRFPLHFSIVFSALFLFLYWQVGAFEHLEDLWHDKLFVLHQDDIRDGDPRIIIAAMDEDTGKKYGFPLPRKIQAQILDKLKSYGVKTVVFDVIFHDPMQEDRVLVEATRRFKKAIHVYTIVLQDTPHGQVVNVGLPISGLLDASEYVGYPNVDRVLDNDGHIRRTMLFDERTVDPKKPKETEKFAPSLDVVAAASLLDKPLEDYYKLYADPEPEVLLINFRKPRTQLLHERRDLGKKVQEKVVSLPTIDSPYMTLSIMDILSGELTDRQRKALKGSLILIGSTTLGYFDHYPNPFTPQSPGVEYHATNIDNMIHDDYLEALSRGIIVLVILGMIWLPMLLQNAPPAVSNLTVAGALAGWAWFSYSQFVRGVHVELVAPGMALFVSFVVQTGHRVFTEGQEKRFIKNLFGQFVAPEVVDDLAKDPAKVKLGGEKRDLTIFFLDIAHFTTISEKMAPEALILFLNKYLSALSQIVQEQKGVVDKYIGDCIMAFWNAPIELKDHRARACVAAIECQKMMKELNKTLDASMPESPEIRIGLNSGDATVGLTGSQKKLQYTVIGDEVNLASRLEGANKFFGSHIMASESTLDGARDVVEARELGRVRVVGKAIPIKVFELLARKGELSPEWQKALPQYEQGVALFNKKEFETAAGRFQEVLKIFPKDGPSSLYLTVSNDYAAIPPPEDWDGVFNLTAK